MKRILGAALATMVVTGAVADEIEYEIVLYLQPDRTGQNTQNKSVELDGDEITIEESGETQNRYEEREPKRREAKAVREFVEDAFKGLKIEGTEDIDYPYIEVQVEFQSGTTEAEITRIYPIGGLPKDVMKIQEMFFNDSFE